ncbi:MAG: hypothetical protein HN842_12435 [Gammaproteobacteria bacterium]|nr:hypothetical protein [Gammaproteobacteria bacterium]
MTHHDAPLLSTPATHLTALAICWLLYFIIHSIVASLTIKQWFAENYPGKMPLYRIFFNIQSLLLLFFPLYLLYTWEGQMLWEWHGITQFIMVLLMVCATGLFIYTLRDYDSAEFFGIRQWKNSIHSVKDQEQFVLSPMHRVVRHPWYFFLLVLLWSQEMDSARLLTAILITLYLFVGSRMEEKKLTHYHPLVYPRYQSQVPALFPNPLKVLSKEKARQLLDI